MRLKLSVTHPPERKRQRTARTPKPSDIHRPSDHACVLECAQSSAAFARAEDQRHNLTSTGRTTIPLWAARMYGVSINQTGPSVSSSYPLGRYMEDNAYLGDLVNPSL